MIQVGIEQHTGSPFGQAGQFGNGDGQKIHHEGQTFTMEGTTGKTDVTLFTIGRDYQGFPLPATMSGR